MPSQPKPAPRKPSWRRTALSTCLLCLFPLSGYAVGLGKLKLDSALGQPLKAEIELTDVRPGELDSLAARIAPPEVFHGAKIERAGVLSQVKLDVVNRAGKPVLLVTSPAPLNEPFLDMLIELNWSQGTLTREYTVLLDPPGFRPSTAEGSVIVPSVPASAAPLTAPPPAAVAEAPPRASDAQAPTPQVPAPQADRNLAAGSQSPDPQAPAAPQVVAGSEAADRYGPVKAGDTLHSIASSHRRDGVDLNQMLLGLYRENPAAFIGENMNRLKAGPVLSIPAADVLTGIDPREAAREVRRQAEGWNEYRQRLASAVSATSPATDAAGAGTTASGAVQPKAAPPAPSPSAAGDVLKLSGAKTDAVGGAALQAKLQALDEEAIARQKALAEAKSRIAALEKNINEMRQLLALKNQAIADLEQASPPATSPTPPAALTADVRAPEIQAPEANAPENPTTKSPAPEAQAPEAQAPASEAATPVAAPVTPEAQPATPAEPWYLTWLGNPLYLAAAFAMLLAALVAAWLSGRRRRAAAVVAPATGLHSAQAYTAAQGASVDTSDTSFLTDFSQIGLGTIDTHDVDPIAEAEVYMAYGRDAQAEEILKEALNKDPARQEIRLKLLEIYAARKNPKAFEAVASELYAATDGQGSSQWERAAEMGRLLDPDNPLYGRAHASTAGTAGVAGASPRAGLDSVSGPATLSGQAAGSGLGAAGLGLAAAGIGAAAIGTPGIGTPGIGTPGIGTPGIGTSAASALGRAPGVDDSHDLGFGPMGVIPGSSPFGESAAIEDEPAPVHAGLEFTPESVQVDDGGLSSWDAPEGGLTFPDSEPAGEFAPLAFGPKVAPEFAEFAPTGPAGGAFATPDTGRSAGHDMAPLEFPAEFPGEFSAGPYEISGQTPREFAGGLAGELSGASGLTGSSTAEPSARPESFEPAHGALPFPEVTVPEMTHAESGFARPPEGVAGFPDLDLHLGDRPSPEDADVHAYDANAGYGDAGLENFGESAEAQWDEVATKLDLAKAYVEMGDKDGAREIIEEVMQEGDARQQNDARALLAELV